MSLKLSKGFVKFSSARNIFGATVLFLSASTLLTACGGSESVGTASTTGSVGTSDSVTSVYSVDTDQIVRNAMSGISSPLQRNFSGVASVAGSMANTPMAQQLLAAMEDESDSAEIGAAENVNSNDRSIAQDNNDNDAGSSGDNDGLEAGDDIELFLQALMDPSVSSVTRNDGDTVTINPNSDEFCNQMVSMDSDSASFDELTDELAMCSQFMQGVEIQIDAASEEVGVATLNYEQQPVLVVDYSPDAGSFELKLGGLQAVLQRITAIEGSGETVPEVMQGALSINTGVEQSDNGLELLNASLAVTEAIEIVDSSDGTRLSLAPSTVIQLNVDEATETLKAELDINGLSLTEIVENDTAAGVTSAVAAMALPGLTARIEMTGQQSLQVTKLGFAKGPLSVTIDDAEMIRLSLAPFGFHVDAQNGNLMLDNALDFSLLLENAAGLLDLPASFSARFSASALAGTALAVQANESIRVASGGPLNIDYQLNDGVNNPAGQVSAIAGQCINVSEGEVASAIGVVDCE